MPDIYFDANYGKLYENLENGRTVVFIYEDPLGKVQNMFIKREIPIKLNDDKTYYDIVTPYGYGGPIILDLLDESKKEILIQRFDLAFQEYCNQHNIVSEFIRFHPIIRNHFDFNQIYKINLVRRTVGTNLLKFENPFQDEFSKSCRKNIRKALRNNVTYKITENPDNIRSFLEIYYSTMDRNNAQDYYYFDNEYFENCLKYFKDNILIVEALYEDKTIAMGFYFIYNNLIHTHLSGTLSEYLYLSPAYILRYALAEWGKGRGYHFIHHGGGTTNDEEDSLYKFKKQFGKHTEFDFYTGKKIWNEIIYKQLCQKQCVNIDTEFFPAYRIGR